jgi:N4-gp56 family major capsid protein
MANIQPATTTLASLTNTIKTFYDRVLLEALYPKTIFYQFGIKKPLPKGEGTSIKWNRPQRLALGFQLSEGVPTSTANALSTQTVSAIISQYGGFTSISDLVQLTSIAEPLKLAAEVLGQQAAETLDAVVRQEIINHVSYTHSSAHSMYKSSSYTGPWEYWGLMSTGAAVVSSNTIIAVSDLRQAIYSLRKLNVEPYSNNEYVAIVHPEIAEDIVGDSTWINWHQYAGNQDAVKALYNGEIGKIYGCRFVETTLAPISAGSNYGATASTMAYGTTIMGKGFYGVTEIDGGIKTWLTAGPDKADPLNQTTLYSWKANFTSKVLNTSCGLVLWTGSGQTTASTTDFNYSDPTAY